MSVTVKALARFFKAVKGMGIQLSTTSPSSSFSGPEHLGWCPLFGSICLLFLRPSGSGLSVSVIFPCTPQVHIPEPQGLCTCCSPARTCQRHPRLRTAGALTPGSMVHVSPPRRSLPGLADYKGCPPFSFLHLMHLIFLPSAHPLTFS